MMSNENTNNNKPGNCRDEGSVKSKPSELITTDNNKPLWRHWFFSWWVSRANKVMWIVFSIGQWGS